MLGGLFVLVSYTAVTALSLTGSWASHNAPARTAVEVLTVLVAALAAYLLFGRARAGGRGRDLALACGVGLFALAEAIFALLPAIVSHHVDGGLPGADATARMLVAAVLAAAALAPSHPIQRTQRRAVDAAGAALGALALAAAIVAVGNATAYVAATILTVVAAAAFGLRAFRDGSELHAWIAGAAVLLGGAHLDAALDPVLGPDWIGDGDLLRCAAALMLLVAALRQLGTYPGPAARRAIAQERRRIARDLHDGLAQELAYIAAHAPLVAARSNDPTAARIAEAAAAALEESRLVMGSLAHEPGEPLGPALARAAERIVERAGGVMRVDLQADVEVEQAVRSELTRIVMEATTNAVRHSGASEVSLSVSDGEALVVRIADDGVGFQAEDVGPHLYSGFGLTSMRERAERAGGRLRVSSDPGHGTVVEVHIA
jgi:signal transduction histidine kinase